MVEIENKEQLIKENSPRLRGDYRDAEDNNQKMKIAAEEAKKEQNKPKQEITSLDQKFDTDKEISNAVAEKNSNNNRNPSNPNELGGVSQTEETQEETKNTSIKINTNTENKNKK